MFGSPFSSEVVVHGVASDSDFVPPLTMNETLKWFTPMPLLMRGEPVWPSGKAFRLVLKQKDLGSNPLRLPFLFKSCGLWTLSCDFVRHN